ncbi:MAG: AbrB/MazE/SpoVT family DNA-binding domain-containing protein, partial [Lachnospiraceae bacterium]|nr:AbrB/MazE/SpoVT family DNA-binding domain-containing protein [Lachnospiraceae bacterium]
KEILKEAGIELGDSLDIKASKGSITFTTQFRHRTLEERIEEHNGEFTVDGEYDWGEPVGREIW